MSRIEELQAEIVELKLSQSVWFEDACLFCWLSNGHYEIHVPSHGGELFVISRFCGGDHRAYGDTLREAVTEAKRIQGEEYRKSLEVSDG